MTIDIQRTARPRSTAHAPRAEAKARPAVDEVNARQGLERDPAVTKAPVDTATAQQKRAIARAQETRARDQLKAPGATGPSPVKRGIDPARGYVPAREAALKEELAPFAGKKVPSAAELQPRLEKTEAWKQLSPEDRQATRDQLAKPGDEGRLIRGRVDEALKRDGFAQQPGDQQLQQLEPAVFPQLPPDPKALHDDIRQSEAFSQLKPEQRAALSKTLTGGGPNADGLAMDLEGRARDLKTPADEKAWLEHGARTAGVLQDPKLKPEMREALLDAYSMDQKPYAFSKALDGMRGSERFQKLSPREQLRAVDEASRLQGREDPEGRRDLAKGAPSAAETKQALTKDPAYTGLAPTSRGKLDRLVGGDNDISAHARGRLAELQKSPLWTHGKGESRRQMLKDLPALGGVPYGVNNVTPSPGPSGKVVESGAQKDPAFAFQGGPAAATRHALEIQRGDRRFHVEVVRPDQAAPGRTLPSLEQIKSGLSRLPDDQLSRMERVVVQPDGKPGEGMATMGNDGTVHISPAHSPEEAKARFQPGEMAEIFSHEVGHLASIPPLGQDDNSPGWQKYQRAIDKDGIPPSGYATTNGPEDFAETYALWRSVKGDPKQYAAYKKLFPNRFKFLEDGGY